MSAKKRTSLDAVFGIEEPVVTPLKKHREKSKSERASTATMSAPEAEKAAEPKRPNVKQHTAYLPLPVHEQLRKLAFEENRKMHDYLVEGLDRVFADRGLPAVKDLS
jgi:hypothetical protein